MLCDCRSEDGIAGVVCVVAFGVGGRVSLEVIIEDFLGRGVVGAALTAVAVVALVTTFVVVGAGVAGELINEDRFDDGKGVSFVAGVGVGCKRIVKIEKFLFFLLDFC